MVADRPPAATPGVKSIYLARLHPTLSRERFVPRWREHGRLAMGLAGWKHAGRYTHGDVLAPPPAAAELGLAHERYFGVGMVWFPGGEQATAPCGQPTTGGRPPTGSPTIRRRRRSPAAPCNRLPAIYG